METAAGIMNRKVVTVEKSRGLPEIVKMFTSSTIDSVIVTHKGKPIGIITERDLIKKITLDSGELKRKKIENIMSKNLISVSRRTTLNQISNIMEAKNIRHLPVVEEERVLGIVSYGDIVKRAKVLNWMNKRFMAYQNIQTGIIVVFFIFLLVVLLYKFFF